MLKMLIYVSLSLAGILIARKTLFINAIPGGVGGGTVSYVSNIMCIEYSVFLEPVALNHCSEAIY